jgi:hypothetical protein
MQTQWSNGFRPMDSRARFITSMQKSEALTVCPSRISPPSCRDDSPAGNRSTLNRSTFLPASRNLTEIAAGVCAARKVTHAALSAGWMGVEVSALLEQLGTVSSTLTQTSSRKALRSVQTWISKMQRSVGVPYGSRTRVAAVKEERFTVIQRNFEAWIALYRT